MKLTATREDLLSPLQSVIGVVERRQTMPVLANVLLSAREDRLSITGTDLEVELVAASKVNVSQAGDITIPGRKLLDIFRALPEKTNVARLLRSALAPLPFVAMRHSSFPRHTALVGIREATQGD